MSDQQNCPKCGQPVQKQWQYCPYCNVNLTIPTGPEKPPVRFPGSQGGEWKTLDSEVRQDTIASAIGLAVLACVITLIVIALLVSGQPAAGLVLGVACAFVGGILLLLRADQPRESHPSGGRAVVVPPPSGAPQHRGSDNTATVVASVVGGVAAGLAGGAALAMLIAFLLVVAVLSAIGQALEQCADACNKLGH